MWPDRDSNLGRLAIESDALLTALHGPAVRKSDKRTHVRSTAELSDKFFLFA